MGFKCVPQVMGLVRSDGMRRDGKGQSKHRANVGAIIGEAFLIADPKDGHAIPFRKSASETYDRTLTKDNKYTGYSTADDVLAAIEEAAAAQTVEVRTTDKETGETVTRYRPLRSDAVIGVAVIFNPPGAVACHWTPEQNAKFLQDSLDVMAQVQCSVRVDKNGKQKNDPKRSQQECHLFRQENVIAIAEHRDEGEPEESEGIRTPNWHVVYKPEAEDGKYKGNLIDVYFLSNLCKEYPRMMRDRGWDIDDCDLTDFTKFSSDESDPGNEEYKAKRMVKIREGGKSVNVHRKRAQQKKENAKLEEAQEILDQTIETKRAADEYAARTRREAEAEAERIISDAEKEKAGIEEDIVALTQEKNQAARDRDTAKGEQQEAEQARNAAYEEAAIAEGRIEMKKQCIEILQGQIAELNEAKGKAEKESGPVMQAVAAIKKERDDAAADRDAARREAEELRRTMLEQARQEAQKIKNQIADEYRKKWKAWVDGKKKEVDRKAAEIIENAKAKAADIIAAATGEHAFLREWFGSPAMTFSKGPYQGKTQLQIAQEAYQAKLRHERVSQIPQDVRGAGKSQHPGTGRTVPGE